IGTPSELTAQLQGQHQAHLHIGAASETAIRTALERIPQVQILSLEPRPPLESQRWQLQLSSSTPVDTWIPEVAKALIQSDMALYEIGRSQASLEEIFLQLTTQERAGQEGSDSAPDSEIPEEAAA
ncbi:MAG: hypothetical protein SNJ85_12070, partial [Cyanobacteriota bacterium]